MLSKHISLILLLLIISGCKSDLISAQRPLTQDPKIISKTLANGFKYILLPGDADDLTLLLQVNTGSLAERDDQQGLAHLIEHMAFQGTEHFSAQQIQQLYSEANMQLGPDINAYTLFSNTRYLVELNKDNAQIDTATPFLGWLANISTGQFKIRPEKLNIEKKVVLAESVLHQDNRKPDYIKKLNDHLLAGTAQSKRMPIGKAQVIQQANSAQLQAFIKHHYQPANSTLVITGKDADQYQAVVEQLFKVGHNISAPRKSSMPAVALNTDNFYFSQDDADASSQLILHHSNIDASLTASVQAELFANLYADILYNRIRRASVDTATHFSGISVDNTTIYNQPVSSIDIRHNSDQHHQAIAVLSNELQRLARFGILESEFAQLKSNRLDQLQSAKAGSPTKQAFIIGKKTQQDVPYIGHKTKIDISRNTLQKLNLQQFNRQLTPWLASLTQQWVFSGAELDAVQLSTQISAAQSQFVLPPTEHNLPVLPIIQQTSGTIASQQSHLTEGISQWTLSNGIKVIMQPRSSDTVSMLLIANGGLNATPTAHYPAALLAAPIYSRSGQNWIDDTDLEKLLIDNKINLQAVMLAGVHGLELKASPEKLNLAFSLLNSTMKNAVIEQSTFDSIKQNYIEEQRKADLREDNRYIRKLSRARVGSTQDYLIPSAKDYQGIEIPQLEAIYNKLYKNAAGYVLAISGNFDTHSLKPLILKHIATLATHKTTRASYNTKLYVTPTDRLISNNKKNAKKAHLNYAFLSPADKLTLRERFKLTLLGITLRELLFKKLREEQGLVYDVSVPNQYSDKTTPYHLLHIMTVSDPSKVQQVKNSVTGTIAKLRNTGVSRGQLEEAKQIFIKLYNNSFEDDTNMTYILATNDLVGFDYLGVLNFEETLSGIGIADMSTAVKQYLNPKGRQIGIFYQ